jgi:hypothetical protein
MYMTHPLSYFAVLNAYLSLTLHDVRSSGVHLLTGHPKVSSMVSHQVALEYVLAISVTLFVQLCVFSSLHRRASIPPQNWREAHLFIAYSTAAPPILMTHHNPPLLSGLKPF